VFADVQKLAVNLSLEGNFTTGIGHASSALSGFNRSVGQVGHGVGQVASGLSRLAVIAGGAVFAGLGLAAKAGANFEAQLNTINTIAQLDAQRLGEVGTGIRELARTTGSSLDDLTNGYYDLLSAGIKVADAQDLLTQSYRLGRGALGSTSEAVDVLTTAINSYSSSSIYAGRSTKELATLFSDELAQAVADGKLKLTDIAATFADIAPLAAQAGIGLDQIAASYGVITAKGSAAVEVTTQMNRAILELLKPSADLDALQKKLGVNYLALAGKEGLVPALQQLRIDATKSGVPFESLFGRLEGLKFVLQSTGVNFANFGTEMDRIRGSAGALDKQVGARNQGLAYNLGILKQSAIDAGLTIAEGFLPALTRSVQKLTAALADPDTQRSLKDIGVSIGKFIDGIDWKALADNAKIAVRVIGSGLQAISAFLAPIPDQVKAVGAALLIAFNSPVLGGALKSITSGVGNIITGLGGLAARGIAAKVPGVGALFAQPVYVVNMPAGGMGGGIGDIAKAAAGAGAGALAGLVTLAAGIAAPFIMFDVLPKLFPGATQPGHGAGSQPALAGPTGSVTAEQHAIMQGLMPSFDRLAAEAGARPVVPYGPNAPAGGATGQTAGMGYQRFTGYNEIFGAHATDFGLKAFRGSAAGAIDLFDERIKYLSGAQGAGAGSKQYLSVVARDISALRSLLPTATDKQKVAITSEIQTLEGILAGKKFSVTVDTLHAINEPAAVKKASDKATADQRETNRLVKAGGQTTKSAIDYAKVEQVRATDAATAAIDRSRDEIVRAILQLGHIGITLTTATVAAKTAETVNRDNITTGSRLGGR
jgi:TP901 family phage tail tape measure protein